MIEGLSRVAKTWSYLALQHILNGYLDLAPLQQLKKAKDELGSAVERIHIPKRLWIIEDVG